MSQTGINLESDIYKLFSCLNQAGLRLEGEVCVLGGGGGGGEREMALLMCPKQEYDSNQIFISSFRISNRNTILTRYL